MNQELLAVLEHLEREKGIKKDILISAVETALVSAVRKVVDVAETDEIRVELDRSSGEIRAFVSGKEIKSVDFGRIAAQTAKQVIIQKIREAEKDLVFNEFQAKIGEIVSGTVYRFERGNIIVDLLGKAEGLLSRSEQSPKEEFRQGERIRVYVLDVRKEPKGAQIMLSRAHPNLVKKLFELEVPEIYEGIVEIKAVSRQPGERTKIAVWSKDEKVDSVGACVGMRGSRVKNIVMELHGERIDIVRFNEDMKEYITASLSPAKVSQIHLDKETRKALVVVDNDQLSLAIGKQGQNVRLASRLVGWELDIRTKEALEAKPETGKQPEEKPKEKEVEKKKPEIIRTITELPGVGEKTQGLLKKAGFKTIDSIAQASVEDISQIKGIGAKKAAKIIEAAKEILAEK